MYGGASHPHRSQRKTSRTCIIDYLPCREAPASSRMLRALPPPATSDYVHVFATAGADQNSLPVNSCVLRQLSRPSCVDSVLLHGRLVSAKPIVTDRRRRLRMCVTYEDVMDLFFDETPAHKVYTNSQLRRLRESRAPVQDAFDGLANLMVELQAVPSDGDRVAWGLRIDALAEQYVHIKPQTMIFFK